MAIENVQVEDHGSSYEDFSLSWEEAGYRFHIWENKPTVLYKNPPLGLKRGDQGYFSTRTLNASSASNQHKIQVARRLAKANNLYELARVRKLEEQAARQAAARERHLVREMENAGQVLFTRLKALVAVLENVARTHPDELWLGSEYTDAKACVDAIEALRNQAPGRAKDVSNHEDR